MDGWMELMDEWMVNRWTDGSMDGWTNGRMDGRTDGQMDGWTDEWTEGRMDGWMVDEWMDGWMELGNKKSHTHLYQILLILFTDK